MKKVMLIAVAMLATAVAQAGNYNWNTGSITLRDGSVANATTKIATAYVFDANTVSVATMTSALSANDKATVLGTYASLSTGTTSSSGIAGVSGINGGANGTVLTLYVVVFDADGYYKISSAVTKTMSTTAQTYAFGTKGISGSTGWQSPVIVPEPTSMALLALGGAVFGLRRKFRK